MTTFRRIRQSAQVQNNLWICRYFCLLIAYRFSRFSTRSKSIRNYLSVDFSKIVYNFKIFDFCNANKILFSVLCMPGNLALKKGGVITKHPIMLPVVCTTRSFSLRERDFVWRTPITQDVLDPRVWCAPGVGIALKISMDYDVQQSPIDKNVFGGNGDFAARRGKFDKISFAVCFREMCAFYDETKIVKIYLEHIVESRRSLSIAEQQVFFRRSISLISACVYFRSDMDTITIQCMALQTLVSSFDETCFVKNSVVFNKMFNNYASSLARKSLS